MGLTLSGRKKGASLLVKTFVAEVNIRLSSSATSSLRPPSRLIVGCSRQDTLGEATSAS